MIVEVDGITRKSSSVNSTRARKKRIIGVLLTKLVFFRIRCWTQTLLSLQVSGLTAHGLLICASVVLPKVNVRLCMEVRARAAVGSWRWKSGSEFHFKGDTIVA